MASAAAPRSIGGSTVQYTDGDAADGPTPAISGVGRASSGRRPGLNLLSGPVCAAMFGSFALCIIIICVYSYLARRRAVAGARSRFLRRIRDVPLSGWSADVPVRLPPPAATSTSLGVPPTTTLPVDVPPAPPSAPDRRAPGADSDSNSNSCRCTVNPTFTSDTNSTSDTSSLIGDCPVCLEPLRVGCGDVRAAHACGHVFHSHCIQPWLHQRGSCPVCRCTLNSTSNSTSTSTSNSNSNSILPVDVPPAPPSAPDRRAPGANSNSCRCTVNPTFTADPSLIGDCPVCLEPLRVGCGDVRVAHACGHVFHSHCIDPWLHQRGSCPVCRCTLSSTFNSDSTSTSIPIATSASTSNSSSNSTSNFTSTTISNTNSTSTSNSGPVDECPLCLEPLHGGGARAVHVCGHTFHSRCIERWWLCHRSYCPMCSCTVRLRIRDPGNEVTSAADSGGARS